MSGSEMLREKEKVAAKMREKQAAGMLHYFPPTCRMVGWRVEIYIY
jgi:hypothetical protein